MTQAGAQLASFRSVIKIDAELLDSGGAHGDSRGTATGAALTSTAQQMNPNDTGKPNRPTILVYGGIGVDSVAYTEQASDVAGPGAVVRRLMEPGGGAVHTAEWAAAMGCNVRIAGNQVGTDPLGVLTMEWLTGFARIDSSKVSCDEGACTPIAHVEIADGGDREMRCVGFTDAAMTPISRELFTDVDVVAVNLYDEWQAPEFEQVASLASQRGVAVILTDVVSPSDGAGKRASAVTVSADTLRVAIGTADIGLSVLELHRSLEADVVVTDGANPLWCINRDGTSFTISPPAIRAVNTTGAGDAFRAGIAVGVAQRWPFERSVRLAAALGATQSERSLSPRSGHASTHVERLARSLELRQGTQPTIEAK
jgi:ribokinase